MRNSLLLLSILVTGVLTHAQEKINIEVRSGKYFRKTAPVFVSLPKPLPMAVSYELLNRKTRRTIPAQLLDSVTLLFMPGDTMQPGSISLYTLQRASRNIPRIVTIDKQENGLQVKIKNKPVFFYHTMEAMPPADSPAYYRRSGFIHPLYSPAGKVMTDDFPAGHAHQHAIFMAWVNATFRSLPVDFWNQQSKKGTVEHMELISITQGPVAARMRVKLRHKSLQHGEVLQELWTITIYPFEQYFLFDLESEQRNITVDTLFLNKYHYGGLGFRGSREWNPDDKKNFREAWHILTSEGIRDTLANQTHARWVDASGKIDGEQAGVTVFSHPGNFRYPQPIRVHPTMPYWCYAPVIDGKFMIVPQATFTSRFRYLVYDGPTSKALIEQIDRDYTEPPQVRASRGVR